MIQLKLDSSTHYMINGLRYRKDSIRPLFNADGNTITLMQGTNIAFDTIPYNEFVDGDAADAPFTSVAALEKWLDRNIYSVLPFPMPFKHVSEADTNPTLIRQGKCILTSLIVFNCSGNTRYLKIYDTAIEPAPGSTPLMVFSVPGVAKLPSSSTEVVLQPPANSANLITEPLKFYDGFGFTIVGGVEDADATPTAANEVIVTGLVK